MGEAEEQRPGPVAGLAPTAPRVVGGKGPSRRGRAPGGETACLRRQAEELREVEEEFGRWRWSWVRPRSSAIEEWRRRSSPRERMNRGKGEDNVGPEDTRRCAEEEDGTEVIPRVIYRVSHKKFTIITVN